MNKLVLSLAGVAALAMSTAGMAASSAAASGLYLNGNVGYGFTSLGKSDSLTNAGLFPYDNDFTTFKRNSIVWNATLGYQFNSYFALEAGYTKYSNVKASGSNDFFSTWNTTAKLSSYNLALKVMYPVASNFDVFAKAGAAWMHYNQTATMAGVDQTFTTKFNKITPLVGLGMDYYLTNNLAVTAQGAYTFKQTKSVKVTNTTNQLALPSTYLGTVGLSYKLSV